MKIVSRKVPYFLFPIGLLPWKKGFSERLSSCKKQSQASGRQMPLPFSAPLSAARLLCKAHRLLAPEPQSACGQGVPSALSLTLRSL